MEMKLFIAALSTKAETDVNKFYQQQSPSFFSVFLACIKNALRLHSLIKAIQQARDTSSNTHQQEKTPSNKM